MERLTDRRTAEAVRDNIEKLQSAGVEPSVSDVRYVRLERIAYHYGYDAQREQFIEECSEAILAAQKCKRHGSKDNFEALCGEVADVLIMAQQMRLLMSTTLIDRIVNEKLERQLGRIENEDSESADSV